MTLSGGNQGHPRWSRAPTPSTVVPMTDQWNYRAGVAGPAADGGRRTDGRSRNDRWIRRPRRSTGDRKIAGVAGGLGRAFGIDPVLIRVAFVVLTIFGGFGGLLYVLGWLLLPADGDEVSAAEALLGRGRSSVPSALAVGLGLVAVISLFSMFSWGLPFLPLAVGGIIMLTIMRRRRRVGGYGRPGDRGHHHGPRGHFSRADWPTRDDDESGDGATDWPHRSWHEQVQDWAEDTRQAARGGRGPWAGVGPRSAGRNSWSGRGPWAGCASHQSTGARGWGGSSNPPTGTSPFERPAFWEQPEAGSDAAGTRPGSAAPGAGVNMTKRRTDEDEHRMSPSDQVPRTTPPAWDPLGVAPFAWDLPEPTPLVQPSAAVRGRAEGVLARVTLGITLLVGSLTAAGVFAGWWTLTWAQVSGIALAVLAVGLLISALRGRGYSLIGPGVFLSLVTMALAVTGVSGTTGYGATTFHPHSFTELQDTYSANAGELTLDLSALPLGKDDKTVDAQLKAGRALVLVPPGMNVIAHCGAKLGHTQCLADSTDGVQTSSHGVQTSSPGAPGNTGKSGTLTVNVQVNVGVAEVRER